MGDAPRLACLAALALSVASLCLSAPDPAQARTLTAVSKSGKRVGGSYHELGHLFDLRLMSRGERRLYKRLIGQRRRAWFGGVNPPAEQFAEAYALCARKRRISRTARGAYAFRTSRRRHAAACALMRRAAGPVGRPQPPKAPPVVTEPPAITKPPPPQKEPPPQEEDESLLEKLLPR